MAPDVRYMRRAIELAKLGRGRVEPNPMVGAVVVKEGRVVGEGWHERFGGPHAEVNALRQAGPNADDADLYVTLEPCRKHGKTPPCADAIIAAGVARVIVGSADPTQQLGPGSLRQAGVELAEGFMRPECDRLVAPFMKLRLRRRPYVTAKWAMTADGRIATRSRDSRWISGEASRRIAHELRDLSDAVIIGVRTALADDPLLTCRLSDGRNPRRVVLDRKARLPLDSRLARTADEAPVWVLCNDADADRVEALRNRGCEVIDIKDRDEKSDLDAALAVLAERELTHVLIEGGAGVLTAAFEDQAVDEVRVFVAPKLVGGEAALSPIGGAGVDVMSSAIRLVEPRWRTVEPDALLEAFVEYP